VRLNMITLLTTAGMSLAQIETWPM
jgi:hypothetical protein